MFRKTSLLFGVVALMLVAPQAHAAKGDMSISLAAGLAVPMGDFSKKVVDGGAGASMGYTVGPSFDYMVTDAVALGLDGAYSSMSLNKSERDQIRTGPPADPTFDVKYTLVGGGAHAKYMFSSGEGSSVKPYILAGLGATNGKAKVTSNDPTINGTSAGKTKFSAQGGVGAGFGGSGSVGFGLEAAYHYISADTGGKALTWVGLTGVVSFGMQEKSSK